MKLPAPEPGLVIRYAYLWAREYAEGRDEGIKDRPCAIVMASDERQERRRILVVPVTHSRPHDPSTALELPLSLKKNLGLDAEPAWVILSESNVFTWPGPDLRRIADRDDRSVAYGLLPPKFFAEIKRRFLAIAVKASHVHRTE